MAFGFNGSNQYLSAGITVTTTPCTLAVIGYAVSNTTSGTILSVGSGTSVGGNFDLMILIYYGDQVGDPISALTQQQFNSSRADTTTGYTINTWQPVAAKFDSASSRTAYLEGGNKGTNTVTRTVSSILVTTIGAFSIGSGVQNFFNGNAAEAAIWNVGLTDREIASLGKGFKPSRIRPQSLVFYAPLIRNLQDTRKGLTITNNNSATVITHPRVY